ncbi:hypothetical protein [Modestobacter excelsi]|uniref:hypothetical protein n=1 Tax=Modestobacter excelsi TaxID=2213161 RepID=UPI00110CD79D|nr:hypothetical protein [Modestobacter excelsi]
MTVMCAMESQRTDHRAGFTQAWSRLVDARLQQQQKDTPAHRAAVAARLTENDAVLDAHLELRRYDVPVSRQGADARNAHHGGDRPESRDVVVARHSGNP